MSEPVLPIVVRCAGDENCLARASVPHLVLRDRDRLVAWLYRYGGGFVLSEATRGGAR